MPRVNTASVREEIAYVEEELDRLSAADKVNDESRVLINTLLMIVNLRVSVFREKTTRKTRQNSSKPSSQTTSAASTRTQGQGQGPAEHETSFTNSRTILTRGIAELPARPQRPSGRRGRLAQSDAQNLWDRLKAHETAILLFARRAEVPFTNNRAERDLRMGKVKQKISGCFRRPQYAAAYWRISSTLQTMARKGINPLVAIQLALAGDTSATTG